MLKNIFFHLMDFYTPVYVKKHKICIYKVIYCFLKLNQKHVNTLHNYILTF